MVSQLRLVKRSSRRLGLAAVILAASGLAHIPVLALSGGDWGGAVSFRKPITFGLSIGILLWTCGWVLDRLPSRPRLESAIAMTLIISGLIEVGLITVQAWRGVPSHFNTFTPHDSVVFSLMGISVGVLSVALVVIFGWSLIERPQDRPTRLAIVAGMALVMAGLGIGPWLIGLGLQMTEALGAVPDTVLSGDAGVAKFPHAMALHGIQVFIATSIAAGALGLSDSARLGATRLVVTGYVALVTWSIAHTNAGRAPADLSGAEAVLLFLAGVMLAGAGLVLLAGRPRGGARAVEKAAVTIAP